MTMLDEIRRWLDIDTSRRTSHIEDRDVEQTVFRQEVETDMLKHYYRDRR